MTKDELTKLRQERRGQRLNIGDRVKAYDRMGNLLYGGKTAVIAEKALLVENEYEYYFGIYVEGVTDIKRDGSFKATGYTSFFAPFFAEDLELMKEPKPKFKVGDKVVVTSDNDYFVPYVGEIVHLNEDSADITIGRGRINAPIDRLTPHTEPTAEEGEENEPDLSDDVGTVSEETANRLAKQLDSLRAIQSETSSLAWQPYRMELAAKIAVAYAEKGRYEPYEIGAKAVEVADGVVDELKNERK